MPIDLPALALRSNAKIKVISARRQAHSHAFFSALWTGDGLITWGIAGAGEF